jgi:hypothetical protein
MRFTPICPASGSAAVAVHSLHVRECKRCGHTAGTLAFKRGGPVADRSDYSARAAGFAIGDRTIRLSDEDTP